MGKKARVLNELLSHEGLRESLDYNEEQKRSNLECLHKTQERLHRQLEFRKKTLQEHPLLSDKYRYYTEQELRYDAASTLMQRRFSVDRNKQEHLEDEFMNYIDSVFYPHQYILILFSDGYKFLHERLHWLYRRHNSIIQQPNLNTSKYGETLLCL